MEDLLTARPLNEWHEDFGAVLWFDMPICSPPYCGTPMDSDWPFYDDGTLTLVWTPLPDCNEIQRRYDVANASLPKTREGARAEYRAAVAELRKGVKKSTDAARAFLKRAKARARARYDQAVAQVPVLSRVEAGRIGGKARAAALSQEERSAIARAGAKALNALLTEQERKAAAGKALAARWAGRDGSA